MDMGDSVQSPGIVRRHPEGLATCGLCQLICAGLFQSKGVTAKQVTTSLVGRVIRGQHAFNRPTHACAVTQNKPDRVAHLHCERVLRVLGEHGLHLGNCGRGAAIKPCTQRRNEMALARQSGFLCCLGCGIGFMGRRDQFGPAQQQKEHAFCCLCHGKFWFGFQKSTQMLGRGGGMRQNSHLHAVPTFQRGRGLEAGLLAKNILHHRLSDPCKKRKQGCFDPRLKHEIASRDARSRFGDVPCVK